MSSPQQCCRALEPADATRKDNDNNNRERLLLKSIAKNTERNMLFAARPLIFPSWAKEN